MRIAIIGAGVAGLWAARRLREAGHAPVIFEKSRGAGGRMATRRSPVGAFDHGAPAFALRAARWRTRAADWQRDGIIATTTGAARAGGIEEWTGVPRMSAFARYLAAGTILHAECEVTRVDDNGMVSATKGVPPERFDRVIVAVPAPQAAVLIAGAAPRLAARLADVVYAPCWTLLAQLRADAALCGAPEAPLANLMHDSAKPGRDSTGHWVAHADAAWSQEHLEDAADSVLPALQSALLASLGLGATAITYATVHRWRYARVVHSLGQASLATESGRIVLCGDYCLGDGVEAALDSGDAAADQLMASM